jgi:hypothetical protein
LSLGGRDIGGIDEHSDASSLHHDDGNDGDGDYEDVSNPSTSAADDSDDDGNDDEDDGVSKASINAVLRERDTDYRPGALKHSDHIQPRHKFEALVTHVANTHGIPKSQAMEYARKQYPDVYRSFQRFTNSEATAKREPDLVEAEMMKGCNREVAMQRVAQLHGFRAFDQPSHFNKRAEDAEYALIKQANEVWADSDLSRCEALREARLDNPRLYRVLTRR